jgi:hypothetical protein
MFRFVSTLGAVAALALAIASPETASAAAPHKVVVHYSLAAGATSAAITLPPNVPISLTGVQTTIGTRGVGQASLLSIPNSFVEWLGLESPSAAAVTSGFSGTTGTHIVYLDFSHLVDVQVSGPSSIQVHNANSIGQTGDVTLIY